MSKTKLVTIESYGKLHALGGIMGPIITPCRIDISTIIMLMNSGKIVYEVNPSNVKEKVRLTRLNVNKDNFVKNTTQLVNTSSVKTNVVEDTSYKNKNYNKNEKKSNTEGYVNKYNNDKCIESDIFVSNKKS